MTNGDTILSPWCLPRYIVSAVESMYQLSFLSLSAEVVFLDEEQTGTPTDLASLSTTKRCFQGDDGRPCSSPFTAFPDACLERYGVSCSEHVLAGGSIDFFAR